MNKKDLAQAARRFVNVIEGLDFTAYKHEHKDKDTVLSKTYELRANSRFIMNADSMEEAESIAKVLNELVQPYVKKELERLNKLTNHGDNHVPVPTADVGLSPTEHE